MMVCLCVGGWVVFCISIFNVYRMRQFIEQFGEPPRSTCKGGKGGQGGTGGKGGK
jgi:hypothetical protein